jgi:hypothetical protein
LGLTTHLYAIKNNNLFFTVDQGRDAVYVREILQNQRLFFKGPETSIRGIFTGPLWYYFVALGYFFSGGHPVGGVWILIILNLAATLILTLVVARKASWTAALTLAMGLTFFWPFFETSLYSFNPFPTAALAIFLILVLIKTLEGKRKFYLWGGVFIFLAFNANLASAAALSIFYLLVGLWVVSKRKLPKGFGFAQKFIFLSLGLAAVSLLFFSIWSAHFRSWQVVYLPPLLFISLILMLWSFPKKLGVPLLLVVLGINFFNFRAQYQDYLAPSPNPSLLSNQLKAIDWIYKKSENLGFRAYNYTDTFYDYPYQYLFWWYGLRQYGYLPDEYANYPLSPKELYVPGNTHYLEPKRSGEKTSFLIIQADTNGESNKDWLEKFRGYFNLTDSTQIGNLKIEKYTRKHDSPNDPCIWWNNCLKL